MNHRRVVAVALLSLLLMPLTSPVAAEWEEDSWLTNIIGPERLALGDEFGCHGIPNVIISSNNSVISECKNYLTQRIEASNWGAEPLSFGIPTGELDANDAIAISDSGFKLIDSYDDDEILDSSDSLSDIQYNGSSFEKNVGSKEEFEDEIIHFGYCEKPEDYKRYLLSSDIIPVTSIQEFFGISVMEAVYCNTYPVLPNRLTYPELFDYNENQEIPVEIARVCPATIDMDIHAAYLNI